MKFTSENTVAHLNDYMSLPFRSFLLHLLALKWGLLGCGNRRNKFEAHWLCLDSWTICGINGTLNRNKFLVLPVSWHDFVLPLKIRSQMELELFWGSYSWCYTTTTTTAMHMEEDRQNRCSSLTYEWFYFAIYIEVLIVHCDWFFRSQTIYGSWVWNRLDSGK